MARSTQVGAKLINKEMVQGSATTFAHKPLSPNVPVQLSPDQIKENITTHDTCFKNYTYPQAAKLFPYQPQHWAVDRYYPLTKKEIGGPVYLDQPMYDDDLAICEKKAKHLKELGFKYIILKKDTDLQSAMEQLGVI